LGSTWSLFLCICLPNCLSQLLCSFLCQHGQLPLHIPICLPSLHWHLEACTTFQLDINTPGGAQVLKVTPAAGLVHHATTQSQGQNHLASLLHIAVSKRPYILKLLA